MKHVGIKIKFYSLDTLKKQTDVNFIDLDSELVDLNYKVASLIFCHFRGSIDSIEHTFLYCQVSKEFFSKTLRWFNEYHKENVQLSNKQILFNTFDDSLPMQMPISTQRKLRLLVLLQKKYLYTCKNIVTKPNLEEFLRKLFEQYRIENCGKQC